MKPNQPDPIEKWRNLPPDLRMAVLALLEKFVTEPWGATKKPLRAGDRYVGGRAALNACWTAINALEALATKERETNQ